MTIRPLQLAVLQVLDAALGRIEHKQVPYGNWSVQGFGVMRLYIRTIGRLHIWDGNLRYPGVSLIHNHSWDLRSTVVAGSITNHRYAEYPAGSPFHKQRLVTGYHTEMVSPVQDTFLYEYKVDAFGPGECYQQDAKQIHKTEALDGTITLMERREDERGEADVYWPIGTEWGTAAPHHASIDELKMTLPKAIRALEVLL